MTQTVKPVDFVNAGCEPGLSVWCASHLSRNLASLFKARRGLWSQILCRQNSALCAQWGVRLSIVLIFSIYSKSRNNTWAPVSRIYSVATTKIDTALCDTAWSLTPRWCHTMRSRTPRYVGQRGVRLRTVWVSVEFSCNLLTPRKRIYLQD